MGTLSLKKLTAADIMATDVVAIDPSDSLRDAMASMTENHVTGLPVLDRKGRCVGLISATDILNYEQDHSEETEGVNADMARYYNPESQRWESIRVTSFALEEFADVPVRNLMTRELVSVGPETPVTDVADKIVELDIHRALVLDEDGRLLGIISAIDFARLIAAPPPQ